MWLVNMKDESIKPFYKKNDPFYKKPDIKSKRENVRV